ncbi:hypothetical protein FRC06_005449 [Ceratobasidium sp. 370]|nr:hypothetical protein FRC06_005449 [Ceratobasidium sp. 370]
MGSSNPQSDTEDARLWQPNFANDMPGAGPLGHATPLDPAPPTTHQPDNTPPPPTTLADADEPWLRGLSAEDIVSQELQAEITCEGVTYLAKLVCILVLPHLLEYKGFIYHVVSTRASPSLAHTKPSTNARTVRNLDTGVTIDLAN